VLDRKGTAITYQDHLGKTGVGYISNFELASSTTLPVVTDSVMDSEQAEFVSKRLLKECSCFDQTTPGRLPTQDTDKQRFSSCNEGEPVSVGYLSSLEKKNDSITPASGVRSATYESATDSAVPPGVTTSSLELTRLGRRYQARSTTALSFVLLITNLVPGQEEIQPPSIKANCLRALYSSFVYHHNQTNRKKN
jgi:hypothetical protein